MPASPPAARDPVTGDRRSAVLVLADPAQAGVPLLFIRRSRAVSSHRGQIAFPGGGADPGDLGVVGTALREAREELGIQPGAVHVAGLLPALLTNTSGRHIDPVLALATALVLPRSDQFEVADFFWVPLATLLDAELTERTVPAVHATRPVVFIDLGDRVIWGATGAIVADLLAAVRAALGISPQR